MQNIKNRRLEAVETRAMRRVGRLARELITANPLDKEAALAALDFERWLAETCSACLNSP